MQKIKPLGNRVLLKQQLIQEEKTDSGIILVSDKTDPEEREKDLYGIIQEIGTNIDKTLGLEIGHLVKFAKHSEVAIDKNENLILVKDVDIQAIIFKGEEK